MTKNIFMKAAIYERYGSPEVLQIKEIEKPVPKAHEILIKVHATTVNRTDCAMLRAKPFIMRFLTGILKPKNPILGTDFSGQIVAIGKNVSTLKVGDKVFGFDDNGLSSHAQYLVLSENKALSKIPDNINYEQAAASIEGAHYANNFINKVHLKKGQKVLVNGASGAIGSAGVQLLKYLGVEVTAVCGTKSMALVKSIGANKIIDYTITDFTKSKEKYDLIFDMVGKSTFAKCKPLLRPGGVYISSELGSMSQNLFLALTTPIIGNKKVVFPFPQNIKDSIRFVKKLMEQEKFKPLIDRRYPLEQIADAYSYVEKGEKIGNVIIHME